MTHVNYEVLSGGTGVHTKAWIKGVELEQEARDQILNLSKMPFVVPHIAVMPDAHAGKGSTVGTVIATRKAIIPAAVGVDIGCVDKDTEFLSPKGWVKIYEYNGEEVMGFDLASHESKFDNPINYIKAPCEWFYHLKSKYGIDQMLSPEHKVLYYRAGKKYSFIKSDTITAEELVKKHNTNVLGFGGKFLTTFDPIINTEVDISDINLRIMVMIIADGHYPNPNTNNCILGFKKERKISRAYDLLNEAGIEYCVNETEHHTTIRFDAPRKEKNYNWLWEASLEQIRIIVDEVFYWDGNHEENCFYTRDKSSADFIQYAFSAYGYRAVLRVDQRDSGIDYRVFVHSNIKVGLKTTTKNDINKVPSEDGFKYCFTMPTGFWIMRRNGVVCVTGNCGVIAAKTSLKAFQMPSDLSLLRALIESAIPHGRSDNGGVNDRGAWHDIPFDLFYNVIDPNIHSQLIKGVGVIVAKHDKLTKPFGRMYNQLGTLGGGNHFIEICLDENDNVWVMIHSGSRGIGNAIGSYFIEKAKEEMARWFVSLPDTDLSYLPEGSKYFDDYVYAVNWAQVYALLNRQVMMHNALKALKMFIGDFTTTSAAINCHHNYISWERHYGDNLMITRKGAVSAKEGQLGIILGSMGARSYIVKGKGNRESFHSCSHGAGRKMSRTKARNTFTVEEHIEATKGIECRKDIDVIDETPMAYKDIDAVMAAQTDLVDIEAVLKQIVCVKG